MAFNDIEHLDAVFKALNTTIQITENFCDELSIKFKKMIIQKSKMSIIKEDLAGLLNRYSSLYHEINDYWGTTEEYESNPFQVFLGNQNHLSNCFLLSSDHLNDNCKRLNKNVKGKFEKLSVDIKEFRCSKSFLDLKHRIKKVMRKNKNLKKKSFFSSLGNSISRLSFSESISSEFFDCSNEIDQTYELKDKFEINIVSKLKEIYMEYLHIELSLNSQATRINQNGFISLNSRFKSNLILLEKDLILKPSLHESKRRSHGKSPDSDYYEYNVDHLINLGYHLPEKPPSSEATEALNGTMDKSQDFLEKRTLSDIFKSEIKLNELLPSSTKKISGLMAKNSNLNTQLLTELETEIHRRESFKNRNLIKKDSSITTISSSDTEENDFDVKFYKYRREVEHKIYYIDDTIQSEKT